MLVEAVCSGFFMSVYIGKLAYHLRSLIKLNMPIAFFFSYSGRLFQIFGSVPIYFCIIVVLVGYIYQYNSLDSQPDVLKSLYSPLQASSPLEDLR